MKNRLRDVIDSLSTEELIKIMNDLKNGSVHIKRLVNSKIKERMSQHEEYCSVCGQKLNPSSVNNYTLVFGPSDFRKKASFCGLDCLEYFLMELKEIKRPKRPVLNGGEGYSSEHNVGYVNNGNSNKHDADNYNNNKDDADKKTK